MVPNEKPLAPRAPTLGELMEGQWLVVEVAVLHAPQARRHTFTDWLPDPEPKRRLAPAA